MASILIVLVLAACSKIPKSRASPVYPTNASFDRPTTSVAQCTPYTIPLQVTSTNFVFNLTHFENDFQLIDLVTEFARKDTNVTFNPISGTENGTAEYSISGKFCSPKVPSGNGREKTVLLTTHGLGYDGRYWDSAYKPQEYSFMEAMVKEGYSVFSYDRLGTGNSQKISGYVDQLSTQVEILAGLASQLRAGSYTGTVGTLDSVVLVGHSFGSLTSGNVVAKYPALVDAVVLTGLAYSASGIDPKLVLEAFAPRIASKHEPSKFSDLDTGYLTFVDIISHVNTFFKAPAYELEAAGYAHSISAPFAIAEFLGPQSPLALNFEGPVLVTTGEFDFIVCRGECYSTFAEQPLNDIFPKSKLIEAFVQPGAGHGVNFATNATGFYAGISTSLERAGF